MPIHTNITGTILICLCVFVLSGLLAVYGITYNHVEKTSRRYAFLKNLSLDPPAEKLAQTYHYTQQLKSKAQFDRMNIDQQMMDLLDRHASIKFILQKGLHNQRCCKQFEQKLRLAPDYMRGKGSLYQWMEKRMVQDAIHRNRPVIPSFQVCFTYNSPQGRNRYSKEVSFSLSAILEYSERAIAAEKHKQSASYQRSLMSSSLRYDIMKRDGFRCVLCGRDRSDGVKLHVDHIIPVSKGGLTQPQNLRTLCDSCNLGKRDKYDPCGPN